MKTANYWIEKLELQKHPEGGWFREIYRSEEIVPKKCLSDNYSGERNFSTSIYYLLEGENISAFHRIKSDEIWHFYSGTSAIEIWTLENREITKRHLGKDICNNECFQIIIPKNTWFAARLLNTNGFALIGCTVSPGFHFNDFELGGEKLLLEFPELAGEIRELIK